MSIVQLGHGLLYKEKDYVELPEIAFGGQQILAMTVFSSCTSHETCHRQMPLVVILLMHIDNDQRQSMLFHLSIMTPDAIGLFTHTHTRNTAEYYMSWFSASTSSC